MQNVDVRGKLCQKRMEIPTPGRQWRSTHRHLAEITLPAMR
jgi:hypothetical protein